MLWKATQYRPRVALRLNEREKEWHIRKDNEWKPLFNHVFGSPTAAIIGTYKGNSWEMHSQSGHFQAVVIVDIGAEKSIGMICVRDDGSLEVLDNPTWPSPFALPLYWENKVVAIIGTYGTFTANISDLQSRDEDIIRYQEKGRIRGKWFVPHHYTKATAMYDLVADPRGDDELHEPQPGPSNAAGGESSTHIGRKPNPETGMVAKNENDSGSDTESIVTQIPKPCQALAPYAPLSPLRKVTP